MIGTATAWTREKTNQNKEHIIRFTFESHPDLIGRFQLNRLQEYAIIRNDELLNLFGYKLLCDTMQDRIDLYEKEMKKNKWKDLAIKFLIGSTIVMSVCFLGVLIPVVTWAVIKYSDL